MCLFTFYQIVHKHLLQINTIFWISGQKFGMLEIKAVLSGILQNFILEPIDTPENLQLVPDIVLRPKDARILVKFIKRQ